MNAEMDVLDVLQHDIDRNVAQVKLRRHQYSGCALMMTNIRSTSSTSCKTPYKAALMTCSRACIPRQPSGRTCLTTWSILIARSSTCSFVCVAEGAAACAAVL